MINKYHLKNDNTTHHPYKTHRIYPKTLALILWVLVLSTYHQLVGQDINGIQVEVSNNINCQNAAVKLVCHAPKTGYAYKWTGPNDYVSTAQSPPTTMPGKYTVRITDLSNGTASTASVIVKMDTIPPEGVKANSSDVLTCKDTLTALTAHSTTSNVVYKWLGPEGFSSSEKEVKTGTPGIYSLTVTNPANGCVSETTVMVRQNTRPPEDVSATPSGTLTCQAEKVKLSGASATSGVNYHWTGPDISAQSHEINVSTPGAYVLEVTDPVNGCSTRSRVTVQQNIAPPSKVIATVSDTLTCRTSLVRLKASSDTKGTLFQWDGPNGFTSSEPTLITGVPGDYTLQAISPENGCFTNKTASVIEDIVPPKEVKVASSGLISCDTDTVTLSCISSTADITYDWRGPDNFSSASASPGVSKKGKYSVEVTKESNGCSIKESIVVKENIAPPQGIAALSSGSISCETPKVKLTAKSSGDKVNFVWTGPDNFRSDLEEPEVKTPGKYTLIAIDPENGCQSETSVTIAGKACAQNEQASSQHDKKM